MRYTFVTLFEDLIRPYFQSSILKRAVDENKIEIDFVNPRDFTHDRYKKVDDYQAGGGAGLVLKFDILDASLESIIKESEDAYFIFLTPVAKLFNQKDAIRVSKKEHIVFVCGRYEGFDERIVEKWADEVFSIGDFILTGGELASLCLADAISRNIDGVVGNSESIKNESFEEHLLQAPVFTKPNIFQKRSLNKEYLKGNHSKIHDLKGKMSELKTKYFRPDLYKKVKINRRINDEK